MKINTRGWNHFIAAVAFVATASSALSLSLPVSFAQAASTGAFQSRVESLQPTLMNSNRIQKQFEMTILNLPQNQKDPVQQLMDALYFIDFGHAAPELIDLYLGSKKMKDMRFHQSYDFAEEPAFHSYQQARIFLSHAVGPLTFPLVQQMHRVAVPWENSSGQGPGTIRQRFVYGPEFEHGLHIDQIAAINQNPYLYFMEATSIHADIPQGQEQASMGDRVRGAIVYPRPRDLKPEVIRRLQVTHPQLVAKISQYQKQHGNEYSNKSEELTQQLITALLEERIATFEKEQALLGELNTPEKIDKYIGLMARFQKDYVSIHPFPDGNGRTSRLLLYYLAEKKGLPAPRLTYPNEDLFWTPEMWEKQVREGMISTLRLQVDVMERLKNRKPIEKSVALLSPVLPQDSLSAFDEYVRGQFSRRPELKMDFLRDPVGTVRNLESNYKPKIRTCNSLHRAG